MHRERFSRVCESCVHDCKSYIMYSKNDCENYSMGISIEEYNAIIRELNLNIKKVCNKHGISNNCMLNMLHGKQILTYKYRTVLNSVIFEKPEYLPYLEDNDGEK